MHRFPLPATEASSVRTPGGAQIAAALTAAAVAPAMVAMLRLFPPVVVTPVAWLPVAAATLAAAATGVATVASLGRGLGRASWSALAAAGGLGSLTGGLALTGLRAAGEAEAFPDGGLAVAAAVSTVLLLAAQLLPGRGPGPRGGPWLVAALLLLFGVVEASLVGSLLLAPEPALTAWMLGPAAAVAIGAAAAGAGRTVPWRTSALPPVLLAGALAALAMARPGALDGVPALLAVSAGGAAYAAAFVRRARAPRDGDAPGDVPHAAPIPAMTDPLAAPSDLERAEAQVDEARADSLRLARELRGTIEELLRARRTIELQRDEIARAATVDLLTGTATRRTILERLHVEAAEARRYAHPVALLLLQVENLGRLNREHGIAVGDEVLREVALRLRLRIRAADALGRVGSDLFLALMPHTDEGGAVRFADALRRRLLDRPFETSAGELSVAVSIGVTFMRPGTSPSDEELLASAEEALASARAAGGNRIALDRLHGFVRLEERRDQEPGAGAG